MNSNDKIEIESDWVSNMRNSLSNYEKIEKKRDEIKKKKSGRHSFTKEEIVKMLGMEFENNQFSPVVEFEPLKKESNVVLEEEVEVLQDFNSKAFEGKDKEVVCTIWGGFDDGHSGECYPYGKTGSDETQIISHSKSCENIVKNNMKISDIKDGDYIVNVSGRPVNFEISDKKNCSSGSIQYYNLMANQYLKFEANKLDNFSNSESFVFLFENGYLKSLNEKDFIDFENKNKKITISESGVTTDTMVFQELLNSYCEKITDAGMNDKFIENLNNINEFKSDKIKEHIERVGICNVINVAFRTLFKMYR